MAKYFKDVALLLWKSYKYALAGDADKDDLERWLYLGRLTLESACTLARSTSLSVAERQMLQASIALMKTVLQHLEDFSQRTEGAGLATSAPPPPPEPASTSVEEPEIAAAVANWEVIESAFENRIRTAVITNRLHLDLPSFLRDSRKRFLEGMRDVLEEHPSVKVNAVLAAEFAIQKQEEETTDIKYFNTKTVAIHSTTNLKEWFATNVEQVIDADIEDFQEQ